LASPAYARFDNHHNNFGRVPLGLLLSQLLLLTGIVSIIVERKSRKREVKELTPAPTPEARTPRQEKRTGYLVGHLDKN